VSKLTDVDGEVAETRHWIETASACGYLSDSERIALLGEIGDIGRMLGRMFAKADTFVP
jgi:four helix bundle protein